jgi:hypothetical protein
VLSWYQGISLHQLEHLHEGGLSSVDQVKLRKRACTIAECANTDELFDVGEGGSDESLDDADFEGPGLAEASEKATEDPTADLSLCLPVATILCWQRGLSMMLFSSRLIRWPPLS